MRCNRRQGAHRVPDEVGRLGGDVGGKRADQLAVKVVLGRVGVPHKRVLSESWIAFPVGKFIVLL